MIVRRLPVLSDKSVRSLIAEEWRWQGLPSLPFVQQGSVVQEDLLNIIGVGGVHHECQNSVQTVSYWKDELQGEYHCFNFFHSKYACDGSAMNSFSCHYCHSLRICNFLIHNVFMKNVKSDGKSKINWAQRLQGYATLHRYCSRHQGKYHE